MERILFFDICSVIIMLILFVSVFLHKMTKGQTNISYILAGICCLLAAVFDIAAECFGIWFPLKEEHTLIRCFFFYGYFIFRNLTALTYLAFMISLTDTWHKWLDSPKLQVLLLAPYSVVLLSLLINPWTKAIFYIDKATLAYTRGDGIFILYMCSFVYLLISCFILGRYRKLLSKSNYIALLSLISITVLAVIIQLIYPHLLVEVFATVVAWMFVSITVQRPEQNVHPLLGIHNLHAHVFDLKRAFFNQKKFDVILVRIKNHSSILSILGHDTLQDFLKGIAAEIQAICKKNHAYASVYYLEQGNFSIILDRRRDRLNSGKIADEINDMLKKSLIVNNYVLSIMSQVCIVRCPDDISDFQSLTTFETIYHKAPNPTGQVLPAATLLKKNQFRLNSELNTIISRGLAEKKFEVHYQPIFSISQNCFVSAEALVRLRDDYHGYIPPDVFIPAAEKNGTIYQIGEYVFEEVCRFIKSPEFKKLNLENIEVNLSVAQCMQTDLGHKLISIANKYNVDPSYIKLEVTETAVDNSRDAMTENLDTLNQAGFGICLDDYGVGYSSIQRVLSLPTRIVKLDKAYADQIDKPEMKIILKNTIRMMQELNLKVIAEGVETKKQLDVFTEYNCDYIQGYYYARSFPLQEFIFFLQNYENNTN